MLRLQASHNRKLQYAQPNNCSTAVVGLFRVLVAEVSLPPPQAKCLPQIVWVRRFSHRIHRIHRNSCGGYSPTDFTDLHRLFGCVDSPTDFTEFTETLAGDILPQISRNSQKLLRGIFSHRLHGSTQIVWVPSRGCTCLKCTNRARSTPTEQEVHQRSQVGCVSKLASSTPRRGRST